MAEHLKDHPNELTRGLPEMIEVLPPGASKAVGLGVLLKEMCISPEEVGTLASTILNTKSTEDEGAVVTFSNLRVVIHMLS